MKPRVTTKVFLCALLVMLCACVQTGFSAEPALEQMKLARVVGKLSVPVEVRYQLGGTPVRDQPVPLELAFIPRAAGRSLKIEFPRSESVMIESGNVRLTEQKAAPERAIRRSVLVTARKSEAGEVRVLVSMDVEGGRYFGVFSIPIGREAR